MAREPQQPAVRPLDGVVQRPRRHRQARTLAWGLFVLGATAGYLLGLTGNTSQIAAPSTTTSTTVPPVGAGSSGLPIAEYEWTRQVPPEDDPDLWAVHTAIEHDGFIYLLIVDDIRNRISRALWRSADGANWQEVSLDLGVDAVPTDLDVHRGDLLLSGWLGDRPTVWRSEIVDGKDAIAWSPVPLPGERLPIGKLERVFSAVTTEVNEAGEIAVVANMQLDIKPASIPGWSASKDRPQIAVAGDIIWTRTSNGGEEDVRTVAIPAGLIVRSTSGDVGTDVFELQAWSGWHTADGELFTAFEPIDGIDMAPIVSGFHDGFVASAPTWEREGFGLLFSDDGSAWKPAAIEPPEECGYSHPAVVGVGVLLLASENFDHTCTTADGVNWEVEHLPTTALSTGSFLWFDGNDQRILAIALNGSTWEPLQSHDGVNWEKVGYTSEMSRGSALLVGNRIVAVGRTGDRTSPHPWTVWVGEPAEDAS